MAQINIGNYTTVAEILKVLKEHNISPEVATLEVEAYIDHNSYGEKFAMADVYLDWPDKK